MGAKPFLLRPSGKDYLWGGRRLKDEFVKDIDMTPLAETWECSTHPDGPSYVASGQFNGMSLATLLQEHPEYLGEHAMAYGDLPILVKFIDAQKDLSVQVHPDDEYALANENGQLGKSEMWYVLDATQNAKLIYGLSHTIEKDILKASIVDGSVEKYLQKIPVKRDDTFFIPAGTIHAIGSGSLIAEIQQNSNLTYRLYDYNRTDKSGNKRSLHINKALSVANLTASVEPKQVIRVLKYRPGMATELLCRCRYFEVYRMLINTERRQEVFYSSDNMSFRVLLCIGGCGTLRFDDETLDIYKGDCVFVPASSSKIKIHGQIQFLDVRG